MTKPRSKPALVSVSRYALLAYNGTDTRAEPFNTLEPMEARRRELEAEGWACCECMGLYWEVHLPDGTRKLALRGTE